MWTLSLLDGLVGIPRSGIPREGCESPGAESPGPKVTMSTGGKPPERGVTVMAVTVRAVTVRAAAVTVRAVTVRVEWVECLIWSE